MAVLISSRKFLSLTLYGVMAFLLGQGQWVLLQGVAWVGMLQDADRGRTLMERASNTFSGEQPCELCEAVETGLNASARESETPNAPEAHDEIRLQYTIITSNGLEQPERHDHRFDTGWLQPESVIGAPPLLPPPISS